LVYGRQGDDTQRSTRREWDQRGEREWVSS